MNTRPVPSTSEPDLAGDPSVLDRARRLIGRLSWPVLRRAGVRLGLAAGSVIGLPLRQLGGLVPRDPRLIAFGNAGGRFTDNPRYLFEALADDDVLTCVWIARTRQQRDDMRRAGHRVHVRWSPRGLWTCLRAGWYVYGSYPGDINYWTSKNARLFNLWHGVGIKAVEFAIETGPLLPLYRSSRWSPLRLAFVDRFARPDYFLSTSRFVTERCFVDAFRLPPEQCLEFGYPRTDHFFAGDARGRARAELGIAPEFETVVGYFPTWRDLGNDFIADSGLSFDRLDDELRSARRLMLFKAHPNFASVMPKQQSWTNIVVLDAATDLNQVLPACDAIVTDYSSVAYDFVLLDRPVIFFVPDYDDYVRDRNSNFSFDEMAAGPIVRSSDELYTMLGADSLPEVDRAEHDRIRTTLWGDYAGGASETIRRFLVERSGDTAAQ